MTEKPNPNWTAADQRAYTLKQHRAAWGQQQAARKEVERMEAARAELEREKAYMRQQYLEAGIDPADFDRDHWPGLLRVCMQRRVVDRESRADTAHYDF
jgi:hypothetical protein